MWNCPDSFKICLPEVLGFGDKPLVRDQRMWCWLLGFIEIRSRRYSYESYCNMSSWNGHEMQRRCDTWSICYLTPCTCVVSYICYPMLVNFKMWNFSKIQWGFPRGRFPWQSELIIETFSNPLLNALRESCSGTSWRNFRWMNACHSATLRSGHCALRFVVSSCSVLRIKYEFYNG